MPERSAIAEFKNIIEQNRGGEPVGTYAVCSSHPWVVESAIRQALRDNSLLHIESTSSQVNQFGGYSGQTPLQFAETVCQAARNEGLPTERVLLGADHLGPHPWRGENSAFAMEKGCQLAHECVLAGYQKIHLDASMSCADDSTPLNQATIAERAALLCAAAENALQQLPPGPAAPVYVIGTEVPTPGGEVGPGLPPAVTTADDAGNTLNVFASAFHKHGLSAAWERVVGLVVQPGVEFGDDVVWDYDPQKAQALSAALPSRPKLVYEAHSTDYQHPDALAQMVKGHFAILKVGPALTFAFREAVFALSAIERELFGSHPATRLSRVREELEAAMLRNPIYWRSYYQGDATELQLTRAFSLSDRCRYYWHEAPVQKELNQLMANLDARRMPLGLLSQYLPLECEAVRSSALKAEPKDMVHYHIRAVLETYAAACRPCKSY